MLIAAPAAAAAFYAPFTAIITGIIVALYALRKTVPQTILVTAVSAVPAVYLYLNDLGRVEIAPPLLFFVTIPVIVAAQLLRKQESLNKAFMTLATFSILFVISLHLIYPDINQFWTDWLRKTVGYVPGATVSGFNREGSLSFVTGLAASAITIFMILTLMVARWMQSLLYNPGGFSAEFLQLRMPKPVALATLLLSALYAIRFYGQGNLVTDLLMVAAIVFAFQGIATLHGTVKTRDWSKLTLLFAYLSLFLLPRFSIFLLAIAGLADTFFSFRDEKKSRTET